jgi:hypothetical protein
MDVRHVNTDQILPQLITASNRSAAAEEKSNESHKWMFRVCVRLLTVQNDWISVRVLSLDLSISNLQANPGVSRLIRFVYFRCDSYQFDQEKSPPRSGYANKIKALHNRSLRRVLCACCETQTRNGITRTQVNYIEVAAGALRQRGR